MNQISNATRLVFAGLVFFCILAVTLFALPLYGVAADVCINERTSTKYDHYYDAFTAAQSGDSIKSLKPGSFEDLLAVSSKSLNLDLNGFDVEIYNDVFVPVQATGNGSKITVTGNGTLTVRNTLQNGMGNKAIEVTNKGQIGQSGAAKINVISKEIGVYADTGGSVTVNSISTDSGRYSLAIKANGGSEVTVKGDVSFGRTTYEPDINKPESWSCAIVLENSKATVAGNVEVENNASAILAKNSSVASVGGSVAVVELRTGEYGVRSTNASEIHISGHSLLGGASPQSFGVEADGGSVTIGKNAMQTSSFYAVSLFARNKGAITVEGNVSANGLIANAAAAKTGGTINIKGSVAANGGTAVGVDAMPGSKITVGKGVSASGIVDTAGVVCDKASIVIDGKISSSADNPLYIVFDGNKPVKEGAFKAKSIIGSNCYFEYNYTSSGMTKPDSFVYVKNGSYAPAAAKHVSHDAGVRTYTGAPHTVKVTPKVNGLGTVSIRYNGSTTAPSKLGKYTVSAVVGASSEFAAGNFTLGTLTINPAPIGKASTKVIADQQWTGAVLKPKAPTLVLSGKTLKAGTDYAVSYKNNKNIGLAILVYTGKGNYTGTKSVNFKILPKKGSISKLTARKKSLVVQWPAAAKAQKVSGYQVQYRANGAKAWTTKTYSANKTSAVIAGLKKGKKYQVQVRSYKTVGKTKFYAPWSATKLSGKVK